MKYANKSGNKETIIVTTTCVFFDGFAAYLSRVQIILPTDALRHKKSKS